MHSLNLFTAAFAVIATVSAIPTKNTDAIGNGDPFCEIPIGQCFIWDDGDSLDCEWCCVNLNPPPGSICHTDVEHAGACGEGGLIWHCAAH